MTGQLRIPLLCCRRGRYLASTGKYRLVESNREEESVIETVTGASNKPWAASKTKTKRALIG